MNSISIFSRRRLLRTCIAWAAISATPRAFAQSWPQRSVRIIVGFAAGGNFSNLARLTAARLSEAFGQQFIVDNRPGAMGTLAGEAVARSEPEGHTFFWAGTGTSRSIPLSPPPI
jgi:tripartite-type tricarboxylate transporter receptor subunit TctC